jgi:hypothetical protein
VVVVPRLLDETVAKKKLDKKLVRVEGGHYLLPDVGRVVDASFLLQRSALRELAAVGDQYQAGRVIAAGAGR